MSCLGKSGQWKQALDLFEDEKIYADKITHHTIANILKISGEAEKREMVKINNLKVIGHESGNITRSKSSVSFDKLIRDAKRTGNFKNGYQIEKNIYTYILTYIFTFVFKVGCDPVRQHAKASWIVSQQACLRGLQR